MAPCSILSTNPHEDPSTYSLRKMTPILLCMSFLFTWMLTGSFCIINRRSFRQKYLLFHFYNQFSCFTQSGTQRHIQYSGRLFFFPKFPGAQGARLERGETLAVACICELAETHLLLISLSHTPTHSAVRQPRIPPQTQINRLKVTLL
jgi:hypothetical protein